MGGESGGPGSDPLHRQALGEAARRHVLEEYHTFKRAADLREELEEIGRQIGRPDLAEILGHPVTEIGRSGQFSASLQIRYEQHPTLFEMGLYSLRERGIYAPAGYDLGPNSTLVRACFPFLINIPLALSRRFCRSGYRDDL